MAYFAAEYLYAELKSQVEFGKRGHPARPPCYLHDSWTHRVWLAWQVLTGRMDAVKWYKQ